MSHACHRFWKCYKTLTFCSFLTRCTIPCACHAKRHLTDQKLVRTPGVFNILTSKCASRIFAPQRRALFRHLNFQKWSEPGVFCTFPATTACTFSTSQLPKVLRTWVFLAFSLANVLRATTACTFSTSQFPKVVRAWCVLYILTWKRASRHNGVQFFISHLASWLRTRRFSEPTFRPSGASNHWKNAVFRDFATLSRTWIFFLLILSLSSPLLFSGSSHLWNHLSILSEVWLLNFLRRYMTCIYTYIHTYIYRCVWKWVIDQQHGHQIIGNLIFETIN